MAKMKENAEKVNFNAEETDFDETETEEKKTNLKSSAKNVTLTSYDELLLGSDTMEFVQKIQIDKLIHFQNHPFKINDDEEMEKLVQSIAEKGVVVPAIARATDGGYYELISGHRRKYACIKLGINTMPVIVRQLDDDEAVIAMVDSNVQREHILPSERAFSYKMKLEAMKRQAGRPSKNSSQVGNHFENKKSIEIIAEENDVSKNQIHRYIRLTKLIPKLLQMVDNNRLKLNTGVELSYLEPEEQINLHKFMETLNVIPSLEQASKLKKYSQEKNFNDAIIKIILTEEKEKSNNNITLKKKDLKQYFPKSYNKKDMENVIFELLKLWQQQQSFKEKEE
ncbi:ParB/RepB/Spo0J family partition protein [Clostridium sp. ASF356]|uniref:ParB/RepB/Spo0J family partition protein n=1 Tax=Clostridium sp. MD294 TaxID=97138 RepID=UPI0002C9D1F5|nr:Nucleoid occlusion protein [Clostridium sp. MD294]